MHHGSLRLIEGESEWRFGPAPQGEALSIHVQDPRFYRTLAMQGTLGGAEAYLNGWWNCDDLVGLLRALTRNADVLAGMDRGPARFFLRLGAWGHLLRRNSIAGSRRNIAAHYDLGDDFFSLFLDETMAYSSGIFVKPTSTLQEASLEKMDRICRKLRLTSTDHLLEIGTGWGGLALHAARHYGCRVTTTTISQRQFQFARDRIERAGLNDRVTLLCQDYRHLSGEFDKLVSVEMIEAVGHAYLDTFFRKCSSLLRPDGAMLLQVITIPDQRYEQYRRSVDFIQKYIFPGGCLPSIGAMSDSVRRATDLRLTHLEDFGHHYARTLACWRERFEDRIDDVRAQGFDERFIRMWHYYLCYCEAAFLENQIGVAQIAFSKPNARFDLQPHGICA